MALAVSAAPAAAAPADGATEEARAHYEKGTAFFNLARYKEALSEFEAGYLSKSDPIFLYNIGQCHRLMGNPTEALRFYKTYLRNSPKAPNRAEVEKRIRDLESLLEEQEKTRTAPPREAAPLPKSFSQGPGGGASDAAGAGQPAGAGAGTSSGAGAGSLSGSSGASGGSDQAAFAPAATVTATESDEPAPKPIYKRWWFWTAIGAVVVAGVVGIAVASSSGSRPSCPAGFTCKSR